MKIKGRSNYKAGKRDEYGSPPYSIIPLLQHIEEYRIATLGIPREDFIIWEPATGMGEKEHLGIVAGLHKLGYSIIHQHGQDFLETNIEDVNSRLRGKRVHMIITKPPFSVALKRRFVEKCVYIYELWGLPFALLMNATTITERVNGQTLNGCSIHIPFGRICFKMPDKGWGTVEEPTKATFSTMWFSRGISVKNGIHRCKFNMSDHFEAMNEFDTFAQSPYWLLK